MRTALWIALALAAPLPAAAQDAPPVATETASASTAAEAYRRRTTVVVYGNDPCPAAQSPDEIVVCARRPEDDRYRIPEPLRGSSRPSDNESWAATARSLEFVGRSGIQSCSTVGPGGVAGCWNELVRAWRRDRAAGEGEPGR